MVREAPTRLGSRLDGSAAGGARLQVLPGGDRPSAMAGDPRDAGGLGLAVAVSLVPEPTYRVRAQVMTTGVNDPVVDGLRRQRHRRPRAPGHRAARLHRLVQACASRRPTPTRPISEGDVFRVAGRVQPRRPEQHQQRRRAVPGLDRPGGRRLDGQHLRPDLRRAARGDGPRGPPQTKQRLQALLVRDRGPDRRHAQQPIAEIEAQLAAGEGDPTTVLAQREAGREELQPALEPLQQQVSEIRRTLGSLNLGVELAAGGGAEVLSPAWRPRHPGQPERAAEPGDRSRSFGLFLGIALAFVRDYFDDSVKSKEMVERVTGVSTLGLIPKVDRAAPSVVTVAHPTAPGGRGVPPRSARRSSSSASSARCGSCRSPARRPARARRWWRSTWPSRSPRRATGSCWWAATCGGPAWRRSSTSRSRPGSPAVLIGDVTLPQAIQPASAVPNLSVLPAGLPAAQPVGAAQRRAGPAPDRRAGPDLRRGGHRLPAGAAGDRLAGAGPHGRHDAAGHVGEQDLQAQPRPGRSSCCARSTPRWRARCSTACRRTTRSAASPTATRRCQAARSRRGERPTGQSDGRPPATARRWDDEGDPDAEWDGGADPGVTAVQT